MWTSVVGWLVALVGIAVSANLLARTETRALRTVRQEAELLAWVPDGPAKRALADLVEQSVQEYVDDVQYGSSVRGEPRRWSPRRVRRIRLRKIVAVFTQLLVGVVFTAAIWSFPADGDAAWVQVLGTAIGWGITLSYCVMTIRLKR